MAEHTEMKFTHDNTTYHVPTNWSEVKYIDFANSMSSDLTLDKKLSYQTTIPSEVLAKLPLTVIKGLIGFVDFMDELPQFFEQVNLDLEVGNEHYIKMEQSRKALEQENKWLAAIEVTKIYLDKDISQLPVTEGFGYAVFFLNRLSVSLKDTKHSANTNRTKMNLLREWISSLFSGTSQR